jgi:hypothetical protein
VVALICCFNTHGLQSTLVEQVASQLPTGSGIAVSRYAVAFQDSLDPDPRAKHDHQYHKPDNPDYD